MSAELNAVVVARIEVSPALIILRVAPDGWELPEFAAGQFAVLGLPGAAQRCELAEPEESEPDPAKLIKRAYSVASSSVLKEYAEFYLALVPSGTLTPRLFDLQPGSRVWMGGKMSGRFTLDQVPSQSQLVLLGTGTGLAPYMSMLRTQSKCGEKRIAVIHGARHSWELGYRNELGMIAHQCPSFTYIPAISRPNQEPEEWLGETGHLQDVWNRKPLLKKWGAQPTQSDSHVFLCGNPAMVESMILILVSEGFVEHTNKTPGQIHLEKYW